MTNKIEDYINNKLTIEELVHYFDKNNYTDEEIKKNGIVYTPKYVRDYIVKKVNPQLNEIVLEPSVGHGIFIFSLLEYIINENNISFNQLKEYFINNVYFGDIKEQNINEFIQIIITYFKKNGVSLKKEEIKNFTIGDTLFLDNKKKYDVVIGNPPYVRTKNIEETYLLNLRKVFSSCKSGNVDLYYAFIEYVYKNSTRSSFITPNSWLYNQSAKTLRKLVKNNLKEIIDFKEEKIFPTASTYTSIFLIDKNENNKEINYKENLIDNGISINKNILDDDRWLFTNKVEKNYKIDFIKFHTPIATLRDKIYITDELNNDNKDLISFFKVSKIKNEEDFYTQEKKILFPYKDYQGKWVIKEESELSQESIDYLNKNKEELNKRDKGKTDKYDSWFAYGRKQGLNKYDKENCIIVIPGMISKSYQFFGIDLSKINHPFLFSSGFLLEVKKNDLDNLLNYLNSNSFKDYYINNGKVWKGKTEESSYYSLTMRQLKKIIVN